MSTTSIESSPQIRLFFDSIARRYDFLNRFLSFKLDDSWRKKAVDILISSSPKAILDLGTGTGKFLSLFLQRRSWERAVGLDFASQMLHKAKADLPSFTQFVGADFQELPFSSGAFDLVVSSYTLRSVQNLEAFFSDVHRVLTPGGRAGFLCLTRPTNPFWRLLSLPYLKFYLPFVGGIVSGNRAAYKFLAQSILSFQEPEKTSSLMKKIGFHDVRIHRFTLGLATLIEGRKR